MQNQRISRARLLELAAAEQKYLPTAFTSPTEFTEREQSGLFAFADKIVSDIEQGWEFSPMLLEHLHNLAVKFGGYEPYDPFSSEGNGLVDVNRLVASSSQDLFFVRFASAVAHEFSQSLREVKHA
jgi:hypothetical protein